MGHVRDNRFVSKLMPAGSGQHEHDFTKFLTPFDPENSYFVYPIESPCLNITAADIIQLNPGDDLTTTTLNEKHCGLDGKTEFDVLKMPYCGEDLESVIVYNNELFHLLKGLLNVFEGLLLLQKDGYMHNDIKDKNIVALWEDGSFNVRVIDFGETGQVNSDGFHIWDRNDYFWSYDFRLYRKNKRADADNSPYPWLREPRDEFWDEHPAPPEAEYYKYKYYSMRNYLEKLAEQGFPLTLIHKIDGKIIDDAWAADLKVRIEALNVEEQNKLLMTCETYSLGITLYKLFNRITGHKLTDTNAIETPEKANKTSSQCLVKNLSRPLFDLILKMCNVDPFKRLSLEDAYKGYKTLIEKSERAHVDGLLTVGSKWRNVCDFSLRPQRKEFYEQGKTGITAEGCVNDGGCWVEEPPGGGPWCYKKNVPIKRA